MALAGHANVKPRILCEMSASFYQPKSRCSRFCDHGLPYSQGFHVLQKHTDIISDICSGALYRSVPLSLVLRKPPQTRAPGRFLAIPGAFPYSAACPASSDFLARLRFGSAPLGNIGSVLEISLMLSPSGGTSLIVIE